MTGLDPSTARATADPSKDHLVEAVAKEIQDALTEPLVAALTPFIEARRTADQKTCDSLLVVAGEWSAFDEDRRLHPHSVAAIITNLIRGNRVNEAEAVARGE